jgi:hypothetical protein
MRTRKSGRLILALAVVLATIPLSVSAGTAGIDPNYVRSAPAGTCFDGLTIAPDCSPVTTFANDWVLAGAAQDAQIMSVGGITTNSSCGGYYVTNTIVSRYPLSKFNSTFNPPGDGVTLRVSSHAVPSGFHAFDITSATHDAYTYIAHLYAVNDPLVAGIAAPLYVLTATPVPRAGPGTMPVPADSRDAYAPKPLNGTGTVVVFDTSLDPSKMDRSPADGFMDATAGHGTFIQGIVSAAYTGPSAHVDITTSAGIITEASMARALAAYAFAKGDVASLSAGTYACSVGDHTIHPLLLADAVERLDNLEVPLVAAAGNDATTQPFYPAAWGVLPTPKAVAQACPAGTLYRETHSRLCMIDRADTVTSVGSVRSSAVMASFVPPKTSERSSFSNHGIWVEAWAGGDGVVSTYPGGAYWYCVPAAKELGCLEPGGRSVGYEDAPAAHLGTHARWSGTSFATPMVAVWIAAGN